MARISLWKKIEAMEVNAVLNVPKDYEESTIRNNASRVGSKMMRSYSVIKNTEKKTFTIIRNS